MKKIILILTVFTLGFTFTNCSDDDKWGDGEPSMEHVYYIGFQDWGKLKNDVVFNVKAGNTQAIPVQFHSERVRSYDVVTYYYTSGTPVSGVDFLVVDESGNVLQPDANGAYKIDWPKAVKGIKNIYVKALKVSAKPLIVSTFKPDAGEISHPDNITNSKANDYEVRAFSQNYKVTVNLK